MSEPPPTPVKPTSKPTTSPETTKTGSTPWNMEYPAGPTNLMLIELLDFAVGVNDHGWDDLPASALSKREISPAADNQSGAEQS